MWEIEGEGLFHYSGVFYLFVCLLCLSKLMRIIPWLSVHEFENCQQNACICAASQICGHLIVVIS